MSQKYSAEAVTVGIPGWVPKEKRRCRECCGVMRPEIGWRDVDPGEEGIRRLTRAQIPVRVMYYGYGPEGHFCSLRCAYRYACKRVP